MRKALFPLLLAILCSQFTFAQTPTKEPTRYTAYGYHKVLPGKGDEFLKLAKVWKKIVAHKKKMGLQEDWSFSRVVSPTGASSEYGYVTRHVFVGEDQLANFLEKGFMPENWQSLLTVDEIEMQLRINEIRTYVKGEVWYGIDQTMAEDISKSKVAVFNYFKVADGKTRADHIKAETDYWKPVHDARVKDGSLKGWLLMGMEMPFGSNQPYDLATVDVYADMKAYLAPWTDAYFKKVHPGKDADAMMKQTREASTLVKGDVRIIIDRLGWE